MSEFAFTDNDPIWRIPPDNQDHGDYLALAPTLWHLPAAKWKQIHSVATGKGVVIGIGDTGYTKHALGPTPLEARSFISGQNWSDPQSGHGCIAPEDVVYTSNCGVQQIQAFFDRMPGVAHFLPDGAIIKDVSRYNIQTVSLDSKATELPYGESPNAVLGHVTHVHKLPFKGELFEVEVNGATLKLTPWHPVYVRTSKAGCKWQMTKKRADQLEIGDEICQVPNGGISVSDQYLTVVVGSRFSCTRCGRESEVQVKKCKGCHIETPYDFVEHIQFQLNEEFAFWLGLVLTDGHITKSQKCIDFLSADARLREVYANQCELLFGVKPKEYQYEGRHPNQRLFCHHAWQAIVALGIQPGSKSSTLELPEQIAKSPRTVIESFFAGAIEGDGCVSCGKTRLVTGSKEFAGKAPILLRSLGVRASVSLNDNKSSKFGGSPTYCINIGSWPGMESRLRIKQATQKRVRTSLSSAIKSITKRFYEGFMYDFTVSKHHNYVANGCIVSNTHCAGTALGRYNEDQPIGVAPDADLVVAKVLSNGGSGSSSGIAAGIKWMADQGCDVISLSLGGPSGYGPTNEAIDYAFSKGCIVNAAAGNSGYRGANTIGWPAKYKGCLCCASYASNMQISNFSSGGNEIDWACPGSAIVSFSNTGRGYRTMSGTSMATPYGSGILALIIEMMRREGNAHWTAVDAVRAFFRANMKDMGAPGFDVRFGNGIPIAEELLPKLANNELEWV